MNRFIYYGIPGINPNIFWENAKYLRFKSRKSLFDWALTFDANLKIELYYE